MLQHRKNKPEDKFKYRTKQVIKEAFLLDTFQYNWPDWAYDAIAEDIMVTHNKLRGTYNI